MTWPDKFVAGQAAYHAELRRKRSGQRTTHGPPTPTPELRAKATAARLRAYAIRQDVALALYQGRLGFIELRNMVRTEQAIAHMRVKTVLQCMRWDQSKLTEWRMKDFTCAPENKLGQLRDKQWRQLISAWPMGHYGRQKATIHDLVSRGRPPGTAKYRPWTELPAREPVAPHIIQPRKDMP